MMLPQEVPLVWPDGRRFAFTIFDDTDRSTTANVGEVYAFLADIGFRTTKSVWQVRGSEPSDLEGETCQDGAYLAWLRWLQAIGFEIGWHLNTWHTSKRVATESGLRAFVETFGHEPKVMANHSRNAEGIYWGDARMSGVNRAVYNLLTRFRNSGYFRGHTEGDEVFWGDLCQRHLTYCRDFSFSGINTLRACPYMPYHDSKRAYVNWWFASSEGANVLTYRQLLSESNQDLLEAEGGACIVYTHFASGFQEAGVLDRRFRELMVRLSQKNGWFVPAGTVLDYLRANRGGHQLTRRQRAQMERQWLFHKLSVGTR